MTGFLGTGATFAADLNLVVQLIMGTLLIAGAPRKMQTLPGPRDLPDHGASFEFVDDRTRNGAVVSQTSCASNVEGIS